MGESARGRWAVATIESLLQSSSHVAAKQHLTVKLARTKTSLKVAALKLMIGDVILGDLSFDVFLSPIPVKNGVGVPFRTVITVADK